MIRTGVTAFGAIVLAAVAAQAQSSDGPPVEQPGETHDAKQALAAAGPDDNAATRDYKTVRTEMMRNAPKDFSGDPDTDYAHQMIAHHQSGIAMARVVLAHGKDATLRRAAEKIIVEQQKEIGELQLWLQTHRRR